MLIGLGARAVHVAVRAMTAEVGPRAAHLPREWRSIGPIAMEPDGDRIEGLRRVALPSSNSGPRRSF